MTLTISVLLLIWHFAKRESPPFFMAFYFLFPLMNYLDLSQIPFISDSATMTQFWYLSAASVLMGTGLALDTYFLKTKSLKHTKEGLLFFGLASLHSPMAFLVAAALMILLKNWFLYNKRSGHPKNASWILFVSLLISSEILSSNQGMMDSIFVVGFFGLQVLVLFAGFSISYFLAAFSLVVMLLSKGVWPPLVHHIVSSVILTGILLAATEYAREKLGAQFGKFGFWKKMEFYIFQANNPQVLSRLAEKPSITGAEGESSVSDSSLTNSNISLVEPRENVYWQSVLTMLFLLIGIFLIGAMGGLYN